MVCDEHKCGSLDLWCCQAFLVADSHVSAVGESKQADDGVLHILGLARHTYGLCLETRAFGWYYFSSSMLNRGCGALLYGRLYIYISLVLHCEANGIHRLLDNTEDRCTCHTVYI